MATIKKTTIQVPLKTNKSTPQSGLKFHLIAKKKLEKIKNKFTEFFLQPSKPSAAATKTRHSSEISSISTSSSSSSRSSLTSIETSSIGPNLVDDLPYFHHNQFHFRNYKILERFDTQYQNNSDDEDFQLNLFDRAFMIDYIAYRLIRELKFSNLINKLHLDLRIPNHRNELNLVYNLAKQIYSESESEPMGLNGLNLIVELELNDCEEKTITRFSFNPTSTLTTFELKIRFKEDSNIICLRRFLPKTKIFDRLRIQSAIYLSNKYGLVKTKLY